MLRYRSRHDLASALQPVWAATILLLLLAGTALNVLGRTGGALCEPNSVLQGHAVWHVLTAGALGLYGALAFRAPGLTAAA